MNLATYVIDTLESYTSFKIPRLNDWADTTPSKSIITGSVKSYESNEYDQLLH